MRKFWESLKKSQVFVLGLVVGIVLGAGLIFSLNTHRDEDRSEKIAAAATFPATPLIFRVIPEEAPVGDEIIIRGGKFSSKFSSGGKVCFRFSEGEETSDCPHQFDVLVWTSGSIRAKIPEMETGEGKLWVVMGEGGKSNELDFVIE